MDEDEFTYAPFGPLGRLFWGLLALLALGLGVVAFFVPIHEARLPFWAWRYGGVVACCLVALSFSRAVCAVVVRRPSLEFHTVFGVWRASPANSVSVVGFAKSFGGLYAYLWFLLPAPLWRLPLLYMRSGSPWLFDHDPYLTQLRRFLEVLSTLRSKSSINALLVRLPEPDVGLTVTEQKGGEVLYSRSEAQYGRKQTTAMILGIFTLTCGALYYVLSLWNDTTLLAWVHLAWIAPFGLLLLGFWWSLLHTSMKVTLGKQFELKRIVGRATAKWERITALRDGGFRHNGLTYLPGCGYAKLQYIGEDGRSRSLVIPPVFWLSDEFRKALRAKLEERGRPGLVIE